RPADQYASGEFQRDSAFSIRQKTQRPEGIEDAKRLRQQASIQKSIGNAEVDVRSDRANWTIEVVKPVHTKPPGAERSSFRHRDGKTKNRRIIHDAIIKGKPQVCVRVTHGVVPEMPLPGDQMRSGPEEIIRHPDVDTH